MEITAFKNIAKMYADYDNIIELVISVEYTFLRENRDNKLNRQEYRLDIIYSNGDNVQSRLLFEHTSGNIWRITIENFPNKDGELVAQMKLNNATCYTNREMRMRER